LNYPHRLALIGLDWGSSNVRAFAFDVNGSGSVIETRTSDRGAMKLSGRDAFDEALAELVVDWVEANPGIPMIACGMVGARGAWVEAGYVGLNASAVEFRRNASHVRTMLGETLIVIPGVKSAEPDVMRGEETQVIGADIESGVIVLPGTHSKWVRVADGRVVDFKTCFTGELNALLREHSSVGKALRTSPSLDDGDAIERGITRARTTTDWLHQLFLFRSRIVADEASEAEASSELSAWLIASEFVQMLTSGFCASDEIHLIGSESLLAWYRRIGERVGVKCNALSGETCVAKGLWAIARA
jgi:2-dehydro-3-deoxygalactonokinase